MKKKKGFLYPFLLLLIFFNIIILLLSIRKTNTKTIITPNFQAIASSIQDNSFIDQTCPDISLNTVDKMHVNLRDLLGKVIIIKFSKFYRTDISNLAYLEHIANKFSDQGIYLLFISHLGILDYASLELVPKLRDGIDPPILDE